MNKIFENVKIGKNPTIEAYVIVGKPPGDESDRSLTTALGDDIVLRSHTVIYSGNVIGNCFQTGHGVLLREGNRIGNNVTIGSNSVVEGYCKISNFVTIHSNCFLGEETILEEKAWIGPGCITLLTPHPRCKFKKACNKGPTVKRNAVIGAGAILLPGVIVGEGAMIGAGAVVCEDIPPNSVAVGSPARPIKRVKDIECKIGKYYERI
jgi:acetyltransferase-like isoleucine patch superfamily enzyme